MGWTGMGAREFALASVAGSGIGDGWESVEKGRRRIETRWRGGG